MRIPVADLMQARPEIAGEFFHFRRFGRPVGVTWPRLIPVKSTPRQRSHFRLVRQTHRQLGLVGCPDLQRLDIRIQSRCQILPQFVFTIIRDKTLTCERGYHR